MTRSFEPREGLDDRAGVDGDRSLPRVEHDERIEPRGRIDFDLRQIADDGHVRSQRVCSAQSRRAQCSGASQLKVDAQLLGVVQHEIPRPRGQSSGSLGQSACASERHQRVVPVLQRQQRHFVGMQSQPDQRLAEDSRLVDPRVIEALQSGGVRQPACVDQ